MANSMKTVVSGKISLDEQFIVGVNTELQTGLG